ncbi:hypothetical protein [Mesorhizobium mediterraneum]|uniref:hypothetical protein n=1 Tax=Mesorhizobium mediterraneum TaxID=43617 RepID=UPI001786A702|nr:hypothetical protein [Mesorhizobium mediterraneum]
MLAFIAFHLLSVGIGCSVVLRDQPRQGMQVLRPEFEICEHIFDEDVGDATFLIPVFDKVAVATAEPAAG